jgi:prepilin-type N-terminal cleavage/methylation domain-containing protein
MVQPYWHHHSGTRQGFSVMELLVVLALFGVMAAIAVPLSQPAVDSYQIAGQAHAVAYDISLAKMQAASGFTHARLYVSFTNNSYRVETWNKTSNTWTATGDTTGLPQGMGFGFGTLATPPPNTQGTIGQASACLDDSNAAIANTSCVMFNSRGIPIDGMGVPTGGDAVYLTDGAGVYAVAVSIAGLPQMWWTPARSAAWQKQ